MAPKSFLFGEECIESIEDVLGPMPDEPFFDQVSTGHSQALDVRVPQPSWLNTPDNTAATAAFTDGTPSGQAADHVRKVQSLPSEDTSRINLAGANYDFPQAMEDPAAASFDIGRTDEDSVIADASMGISTFLASQKYPSFTEFDSVPDDDFLPQSSLDATPSFVNPNPGILSTTSNPQKHYPASPYVPTYPSISVPQVSSPAPVSPSLPIVDSTHRLRSTRSGTNKSTRKARATSVSDDPIYDCEISWQNHLERVSSLMNQRPEVQASTREDAVTKRSSRATSINPIPHAKINTRRPSSPPQKRQKLLSYFSLQPSNPNTIARSTEDKGDELVEMGSLRALEPRVVRGKRNPWLGKDPNATRTQFNNQAQGVVEFRNGQLLWHDNRTGNWHPCVFHNDIRHELLRKYHGKYRVRRAQGKTETPYDSTSFLPSQKRWDCRSRDKFGSIAGGILYQIERPNPPNDDTPIERWVEEGRLVLDYNKQPMPFFPELPHVLSSRFEAAFIEAIKRLNHRIGDNDFLARMPLVARTSKDGLQRLEPPIAQSALNARAQRFRAHNGIAPWEYARAGAKLLETIKQRAREAGCPPGSTEGLVWGLNEWRAFEESKKD